MKTIKILSIHNTLAEAVQVSGYDVSYNPAEYHGKIKRTDEGSSRHGLKGTVKAFIVEGYEYGNPVIMYVVSAEGINILHTFSLTSCLSSCDLQMCIIDEAGKVITQTGVTYPKTKQGRASMASACAFATAAMIAFN